MQETASKPDDAETPAEGSRPDTLETAASQPSHAGAAPEAEEAPPAEEPADEPTPRRGGEDPPDAAASASVDERILFHEELSWKQIDELDRDRTAFFLTVAPVDQHGPHLPVGVDCFTAQAFSAAAARRLCKEYPEWTAVLSPILPIGAQTFDYLGSVRIRRRILRDLLTDFGSSLAAYDFRNIVVVTAHGAPGHLMAIDEACAAVNDRFDARMHSPMPRVLQRLFSNGYRETLKKALGRNGSTLDLSSDHHAGHFETSVMLYLRPELVDPGYSRLKQVEVDAGDIDEAAARTLGDRLGYFGAPANADRDLGKVAVALVGREIVDTFLQIQNDPDLLDLERPPLFDRRVVYRTDFMRWVLAALVLALVASTWLLFL